MGRAGPSHWWMAGQAETVMPIWRAVPSMIFEAASRSTALRSASFAWAISRTWAFVTEPTGHLAATFVLLKDGSNYASENTWNLVASDDEWTSPIFAEVGPDGQVWMIDWYNFIVQHNPTPAGFENGKGNAYETPLRDKVHGRIWRVVHDATQAAPAVIGMPTK